MKLFPQNHYTIRLQKNDSSAISDLQKQTLSNEQFVSNWKNQTFIGTVKDNTFNLVLSKKLYGSFVVFSGNVNDGICTLNIKTSKKIQIIFYFSLIFPVLGFIVAISKNGIENITNLVIPTIMIPFIFRFIFIELSFKIISRNGLKKFKNILNTKKY